MTLLLLLLATASADTWSSTVEAILRAPELAWLEVGDERELRTVEVLRGGEPPADLFAPQNADVGATVLRACGSPSAHVCVYAVQRGELFWFEQGDLGLHTMGHVPPGVSTRQHLDALIIGQQPLGLCLRVGEHAVVVDAGTGAGSLGTEDPVGAIAGAGTVRIEHYDPRAPVYVGRAGHTSLLGRNARLEQGCVVADPA